MRFLHFLLFLAFGWMSIDPLLTSSTHHHHHGRLYHRPTDDYHRWWQSLIISNHTQNGETSILTVPIQSSRGSVIGVAQLVNKSASTSGPDTSLSDVTSTTCNSTNDEQIGFNEVDVTTLEAVAIFCGLGIHNTQMYERALKLIAKQRVALELLAYHASSTADETHTLMVSNLSHCLLRNRFGR